MIHDEVKQARIEAGLSQVELARRAGVQRKQVQAIESGANVTLETIRQILPSLPNLKRVTLGGLAIEVANVDVEEAPRGMGHVRCHEASALRSRCRAPRPGRTEALFVQRARDRRAPRAPDPGDETPEAQGARVGPL